MTHGFGMGWNKGWWLLAVAWLGCGQATPPPPRAPEPSPVPVVATAPTAAADRPPPVPSCETGDASDCAQRLLPKLEHDRFARSRRDVALALVLAGRREAGTELMLAADDENGRFAGATELAQAMATPARTRAPDEACALLRRAVDELSVGVNPQFAGLHLIPRLRLAGRCDDEQLAATMLRMAGRQPVPYAYLARGQADAGAREAALATLATAEAQVAQLLPASGDSFAKSVARGQQAISLDHIVNAYLEMGMDAEAEKVLRRFPETELLHEAVLALAQRPAAVARRGELAKEAAGWMKARAATTSYGRGNLAVLGSLLASPSADMSAADIAALLTAVDDNGAHAGWASAACTLRDAGKSAKALEEKMSQVDDLRDRLDMAWAEHEVGCKPTAALKGVVDAIVADKATRQRTIERAAEVAIHGKAFDLLPALLAPLATEDAERIVAYAAAPLCTAEGPDRVLSLVAPSASVPHRIRVLSKLAACYAERQEQPGPKAAKQIQALAQ